MNKDELIKQHLKYKDKTMDELIEMRILELRKGQNELRKKWLPEKYDANLEEK